MTKNGSSEYIAKDIDNKSSDGINREQGISW